MVTIRQAKVVQDGTFKFHVDFLYNSNALSTIVLPNTSSQEDVKEAMKQAVDTWEKERAESNLNKIITAFDGKDVVL